MIKNKKQILTNPINKTLGSARNLIKVYLAVFAFLSLGVLAQAQTAMVTKNYVSYPLSFSPSSVCVRSRRTAPCCRRYASRLRTRHMLQKMAASHSTGQPVCRIIAYVR